MLSRRSLFRMIGCGFAVLTGSHLGRPSVGGPLLEMTFSTPEWVDFDIDEFHREMDPVFWIEWDSMRK